MKIIYNTNFDLVTLIVRQTISVTKSGYPAMPQNKMLIYEWGRLDAKNPEQQSRM